MIYFKDTNDEVYAYKTLEDKEQYGPLGLVELTQEEVDNHLNVSVLESVPEQVSRAQGKTVLITAGLWPDVLAFVESITDPTEKALAEVALSDTTHWRRDSPTLQATATALDITSEQMDDLFITASSINL